MRSQSLFQERCENKKIVKSTINNNRDHQKQKIVETATRMRKEILTDNTK